MKSRKYIVKELKSVLLFCPSCHRQIELPKFAGQVKCEGGLNLLCGCCKKGKAMVKVEQTEGTNE